MIRVLSALALFFSVGFFTPLSATLTPGGGLILFSTLTNIGHLSSAQTLSLDLVTAQVADVEMRVVNVHTNEVVAQITKIWDYYTQTPLDAGGGAIDPIVMIISSSNGVDVVNFTGFPEGDYRVELDMLFPDYWGSHPWTWYAATNYFDSSSGNGSLYIDVGGSQSDVWSWGGAGLLVY